MVEDFDFARIVHPAMTWFIDKQRNLPWRQDRQPYHIWVSEIMLQQTRVEAVIGYYQRFMEALPTIRQLAQCPEDQLMKLWEGLGYYNRVRSMQCAARQMEEEYGGCMPQELSQLLQLKGIGNYTARAIASQAFHKPVAAVDGNVLRVVTRLARDPHDIGKEAFKRIVEQTLDRVMPQETPGDMNQALMEIGACVCIPNGEPHCKECPLAQMCMAYEYKDMLAYPVKEKLKKRRVEKKTVFIIRNGDNILLHKRKNQGLLAGLYEFPNVEGYLTEDDSVKLLQDWGLTPLHIQPMEGAKHIFSHVEWHMAGYVIRVDETAAGMEEFLFVERQDIERKYSVPAAFEGFKRQMNIISQTTKQLKI